MWFVGSFQTGPSWDAEDPLDEVWSRTAQVGSHEHLTKHFTPEKIADAAAILELFEYIVVRFRQAVEFRVAGRSSSQLTSPLAFYYSFLNLLRGGYAIRHEAIPTKKHGLTFNRRSTILECSCTFAGGSFTEFLSGEGIVWTKGHTITLDDVFSRMSELRADYARIAGKPALVDPVTIRASTRGETLFDFRSPDGLDFKENWSNVYAQLAAICTLEPEGNTLRLKPELAPNTYEAVGQFLGTVFDADLRQHMNPVWFAQRHVPSPPSVPRLGYYFVGMFILGSIVRYEPELVREIADPDREISWLVGRFIKVAERFFPQLVLNWISEDTIYY